MARTKIICTLGPASSAYPVLRKMMIAGMDVVRLNFSHSSHPEAARRIAIVRQLNRRYRRHIRILGDLEGPRIRIGALSKPIELKKRMILWFAKEGRKSRADSVPFDYPGDLCDIKKGSFIYIDDGMLAVEVTGHSGDRLAAKVIVGGILKSHKGVNIPGVRLHFSSLSVKDKKDVLFCLAQGVDFIAQSFVRNAKDVAHVRQVLGAQSASRVIAKIENEEGIANLDEIIRISDGIMVARGDLGVSLPIYEVPVLQKKIIEKCNRAKKFVITATQMLESMTENLRPTRAEVSDVANAIIDGTDYLMLSAETAVGKHPVETIRLMNQVVRFTEHYLRA